MADLRPLIDELGAAATNVRQLLGDVRAATRDLRQTIKDAEQAKAEITKAVETAVAANIEAEVRTQIEDLKATTSKAMDDATTKVFREFDKLTNLLTTGNRRGRTQGLDLRNLRRIPSLEELMRQDKQNP
jgi:signal transduction histidine kinase